MNKKYAVILGLTILILIGFIFIIRTNIVKKDTNTPNTVKMITQQDFINDMTKIKTSAYNGMAENSHDSGQIFYGYLKILQNKIDSFNNALPKDIKSAKKKDDIAVSTLNAYKNSGVDFMCKNGSCYAVPNYQVLLQEFYNVIPTQYRLYLALLSEDFDSPVISDNEIIVSFETIRQRILKYEGFIKKYPDFPSIRELKERTDFYYNIYKNGYEKTIVDCNSSNPQSKLDELHDIKESYSKFLAEYSGSDEMYYKEIKACHNKMGSLKRNGQENESALSVQKFLDSEQEFEKYLKDEKDINKRSMAFKNHIDGIKNNIGEFNQELCGSSSCENIMSRVESIDDNGTVIKGVTIIPSKPNNITTGKLLIKNPSIPVIYIMQTDENYYQTAISYNYLKNQYDKYLSEEWKEYLRLKSKPEIEFASGSMLFGASKDRLINYVNDWQTFLMKYPNFIMNPDIREEINNDYYQAFVSVCCPLGTVCSKECDRVLDSLPINSDLYKKLSNKFKF